MLYSARDVRENYGLCGHTRESWCPHAKFWTCKLSANCDGVLKICVHPPRRHRHHRHGCLAVNVAMRLRLWLIAIVSSVLVQFASGEKDFQSATDFAAALQHAANTGNVTAPAGNVWCPLVPRSEIDGQVIGISVCVSEFAPCSLCSEAEVLVFSVTTRAEVSFLLDQAKEVR